MSGYLQKPGTGGGGGGTPAGSDTQIQYNNAGAFGADAEFTRDGATGDTTILKTVGTETIGYKVIDNLYSTFTGAGTTYLNTATDTFGLSGILINTGIPLYQTLLQYGSGGVDGFASVVASNEGVGLTAVDESGTSVEFDSSTADKLISMSLGVGVYNNTLQLGDGTLIVDLPHTTQSAVSFTGSGLDDLTVIGKFSGTVPTTYTVTIDGVNVDIISIESSTISGGTFAVGNTITNGLGGIATVNSVVQVEIGDSLEVYTYLGVTVTAGTFGSSETIDNGTGVTGTGSYVAGDTFGFTDGTITYSNAPVLGGVLLSNGIKAEFANPTGHTLSDSWTWDYTTVNQNVLDFSNNDYKFQSVFGTDTFGYQIGDNLLGAGITGSANIYTNTDGDLGISGILNSGELTIGYSIQDSYGENVIQSASGVTTIGNLSGGNGTSITIDDLNEQITIGNIKAFDDDAAAGTAGLTAGMVYMTTGSGAAPLNAAGILMIKQ